MSDDLHVHNNTDVTSSSHNPSDDYIEESVRSSLIQKDDKTGSIVYPDHPEEQQDNNNQYGVNLPERDGEPDCAYFIKTAICVFGSTCKYNHPRDRHGASLALNAVGLPIKQGQDPCSHYLRTGSCKFGVACKFHHPQPVECGPGPTYAPGRGNAHAWPYLSQQTFMPIIIPSMGPTQVSGPHIGNKSPILSTNGLTSVDHVKPSKKSSKLPERPGEPECRYFMSTGTCKYTSRCKFHHPMETMVKYGANPLGPFGLPLKHGQPICWYYSIYGTCNYGANCKFDHPLMAYSYNHFNGLTALQMVDLSFHSYGVTNSYDSSTLKSFKNPRSKREQNDDVKLGTDDSCGDRVGSSHL